jgi:hypothetical protein
MAVERASLMSDLSPLASTPTILDMYSAVSMISSLCSVKSGSSLINPELHYR